MSRSQPQPPHGHNKENELCSTRKQQRVVQKHQLLLSEQLDKLTELDKCSMKPGGSSANAAPIYDPGQSKRKLFSQEAVKLKLRLYDLKMSTLRSQSDSLEALMNSENRSVSSRGPALLKEFLNDVNMLKQNCESNFAAAQQWFDKQHQLIQTTYTTECGQIQDEFIRGKHELKESLLNQLINNRKEIEDLNGLDMAEHELNEVVEEASLKAKLTCVLSADTNSKRKQSLVPKLRPRASGKTNFLSSENGDRKSNAKPGLIQSNQRYVESGGFTRKTKSSSIETRLQIQFQVSEEELNDDLKLLQCKYLF